MPRAKKIYACDAETDPFLDGRVPFPFIWGLYDGKDFETFNSTDDFVARIFDMDCIIYAHNGGKFDFMYLIKYVKETKAQIINGRIVSMFIGRCELRDSYSIIPEPLRNFGDKREIDYKKLERSVRNQHRPEITEYLFYDCKILFDAVKAYREQAGSKKTIASNALSFAKTKLKIDPGKTNHRFDTKYRKFYFGGRTECFIPGTHKNINGIDIHSAYPYAMIHDHATGSNFVRGARIEEMSDEQIQRSFIIIECNSRGAFPKREIGPGGGLFFPYEYNEFHITGWEYLVARNYGLFDNAKIHSIRYTEDKINFASYVSHWYEKKSSISKKIDPINYTIAKIMMNSLYGKLAQNITKYFDYKIMPAGSEICDAEFRPLEEGSMFNADTGICKLCGAKDTDHGWQLGAEFDNHEIHRRPSLYKYKLKFGAEWQARSLYNNVATGASITGFTRAHLLKAICEVGRENVIYCDTDSIVCKEGTDLSRIPFTPKLGDWELEFNNAPVGHFEGKKLYGIDLGIGECTCNTTKDCKRHKIASKGSRLAFNDLRDISNGKTVVWKSQAPSFSVTSGKVPDLNMQNISKDDPLHNKLFVVRKIRATSKKPVTN